MDRHPWAVDEARRTFADLGLRGTFRIGDIRNIVRSGSRAGRSDAILLAYTVNEIADSELRGRLVHHDALLLGERLRAVGASAVARRRTGDRENDERNEPNMRLH